MFLLMKHKMHALFLRLIISQTDTIRISRQTQGQTYCSSAC